MVNSLMGHARFGEIWVRNGTITKQQLDAALIEQQHTRKRLGEILISHGLITERDVAEARAHQLDVPFCDVAAVQVEPHVAALVPPEFARSYSLLPIEVNRGRLRVAMANPNDVESLDLLQRMTRLRPDPMYSDAEALLKAVESIYGSLRLPLTGHDSIDAVIDEVDVEPTKREDHTDVNELISASEQAPVIKMVNLLLSEAVRARASDIHLEPRQNNLEVRFRIDGALRKARVLPKTLQLPVTSRLKIMSELDISEKRLPQDGRIALTLDNRALDLRVSTLPTHYGERVVMRILDKSASIRPLDKLDMSETNRSRFESLIRQPFGIIIVTGPTGSGKTTTLYSALGTLKDEATNIITCEDPIEYDLDGINQSAVNDRAGLTFARQLRAILRQDPDIVLVGEIRDYETAEIAFRAAMTGHLVLSTLHANDAPSAVTRLFDMGVPPFLVASGLIGVVAQRLARRLCEKCRTQRLATPTEAALLGAAPNQLVWYGEGCQACDGKGYHGRIGIHEVMTCDEEFSRLIMQKAPSTTLREAAIASGMVTLGDDALAKVRAGITSVDEIARRVQVADDPHALDLNASAV